MVAHAASPPVRIVIESNQRKQFGYVRVDEREFRETQRSRAHAGLIREKFKIDWTRTRWSELQRPLYSAIAARVRIDMKTMTDGIPRSLDDQALFWANVYRPSVRTGDPQYFKDRVDDKKSVCFSPRADIVFVLDGSGSITAPNFLTMKNFAKKVVEQFTVGPHDMHVGVIQYSSDTRVEFHLGSHNTNDAVVKAIDRIEYKKGGTNSAAALEAMVTMFEEKGRGDEGVPQLALFMTDGASNDPNKTTAAAAKVHSETDITVFAMGVGAGFVPEEIERIGSKPACVHVSGLANFSDVEHFVSQIAERACNAPSSMISGKLFSGSIAYGKKIFLKVKVKKSEKGLTIRLNAESGGVMLFASWTIRNPNSVKHKYAAYVDTNSLGQTVGIPWFDSPDQDAESAELYITLVGLDKDTGNGYQIEFTDGNFASGAQITQSALSLVFGAFLLWLAW